MPIIKTKRNDILRQQEIEQSLQYADPWLRCLIALNAAFGKRITEYLKLKREEVWTDKDFLYVRFHVGKKRKNKDKPFLKRINLKHWTIHYIQPYLTQVQEGQLFHVSRQLALYYLKQLNPNSYFHLFRESLATEMAERGATEEQLMHWFDWDTPNMAHEYVKRGTKLTEQLSERQW